MTKFEAELKASQQNRKDKFLKPLIFNPDSKQDILKILAIFKNNSGLQVLDSFKNQFKELFLAQNPELALDRKKLEIDFKKYLKNCISQKSLVYYGRWVYFPWKNTLGHILEDQDFQLVRTSRNRYLINQKEQEIFYESVIGIAGLSVGNSVALAIAIQGGGQVLRLADFDKLELSNLNRIRSGICELGKPKTDLTSYQIYELNPYNKVEVFKSGINPENFKKFIEGPPKLDIIIDELDDLSVKYLLRVEAKKLRLPVIMAADNGDGAVIDIERYDLDPDLKFFHGRLGEVTYDKLKKLDKMGIGKMITRHVGIQNISERMYSSLISIGKSVVSWPQLGGAAMLSGASLAYCARQILNKNKNLELDRAIISLDEKLISGYNSSISKKKRLKTANEIKKLFDL